MEQTFLLSSDCYCNHRVDEETVVYDTKDNRTLLLTDLLATIYDYIRALKHGQRFSELMLFSQLQADSIQCEPGALSQGLDQLLDLKLIKLA